MSSLLVTLVSLFLITANTSGQTWTTEAVDAPKLFSNFYSKALAVDNDDHPHIDYGSDYLYYAYYDVPVGTMRRWICHQV